MLSDVPTSFGSVYLLAKLLLLLALAATMFLPRRIGLSFILMITVAGRDIVQATTEAAEFGEFSTASLWQGKLGPLGPSWLILLAALVLMARGSIYLRDRPVVWAAVWFATVPVLTGLAYGGFQTSVASIQVPVDIKMGAFILVSVVLYRSYLRRHPQFLTTLGAVLIGSALARHGLDFVNWLRGSGSVLAGVNRVSVDSTKGTVVLLLLLGIYLIFGRRRVLIGSVLALGSGLLVIAYVTRTLWFVALLGAIVILMLLRTNRRVLAVPVVILVALGSLQVLAVAKPEVLDLVSKRIHRSGAGEEGVLQQLDRVRYLEIINSTHTTNRRFAQLWGSGYGGYYTDEARPFPRKLYDAFPDYSLESGQFFRCHNYVFQVLFKHGILGLLIISALWVVPAWRCFELLRGVRPSWVGIVVGCVVAFMITAMMQMTWSAKGALLNGVLIAICLTVAELGRAPVEAPQRQIWKMLTVGSTA